MKLLLFTCLLTFTALGIHCESVQDCVKRSLDESQLEVLAKQERTTNGIFFGIALNGTFEEYKKNCDLYIEIYRKSHHIHEQYLSHCFVKEQTENFKTTIDGMAIFCDFDEDVKNNYFHTRATIETCDEPPSYLHRSCVDYNEDLCNEKISGKLMECIKEKLNNGVCSSQKDKDLMIDYYNTMIKFSKDKSHCGTDHALVQSTFTVF